MAVRAFRVRLDVTPDTLEHLWRTHRAFNDRLKPTCLRLFQMRRREAPRHPELYERIANFVLGTDARNAPYLLNSVSVAGWKPGTALKMKSTLFDEHGNGLEVTGEGWATEAAELAAVGDLLYSKGSELGDLPDSLRQVIVRDAVEVVRSHLGLVREWHTEHRQWLAAKAAWEASHPEYFGVRPVFELFEKDAGRLTGRRGRWSLYRQWLLSHPELATWRGGPAEVHDLTDADQTRLRRTTARKRAALEMELFFAANPELRELDRQHGFYEREYMRRRKTKRHRDGFDHRPTFTLPDAVSHPRWCLFNAPQTSPTGYRNLQLPTSPHGRGALALNLLVGERVGDQYSSGWVTFTFRPDARMADLRAVTVPRLVRKGKTKGDTVSHEEYRFRDRHLGIDRQAQVSGCKLILKKIRLHQDGTLKSAVPYLVFACEITSEPRSELAKQITWSDTGEVTKTGKARKRRLLPDGLVTCAIDLGIRNLGFATLARWQAAAVAVIRSRNLWIGHEEHRGSHAGRWQSGPQLYEFREHQQDLRRLRRLRGMPVLGEESAIELQRHLVHFTDDRSKKAARAIIQFAVNARGDHDRVGVLYPRADVLLLEDLEGLIPRSDRERGINRSLMAFHRGHLVKHLEHMAEDAGLRLILLHPMGTSQVCSRCGALGSRYTVRPDRETRKPVIQFEPVGKLFACVCGYRANADHNASVNLHRKFFLGDAAIEEFLRYQKLVKVAQVGLRADREALLRPVVQQMHGLDGLSDGSPF